MSYKGRIHSNNPLNFLICTLSPLQISVGFQSHTKSGVCVGFFVALSVSALRWTTSCFLLGGHWVSLAWISRQRDPPTACVCACVRAVWEYNITAQTLSIWLEPSVNKKALAPHFSPSLLTTSPPSCHTHTLSPFIPASCQFAKHPRPNFITSYTHALAQKNTQPCRLIISTGWNAQTKAKQTSNKIGHLYWLKNSLRNVSKSTMLSEQLIACRF